MPYKTIFRHDLLAGSVVLITGGGSGIGRAIAHDAASCGATVCIAGRTKSKLDATVKEILSVNKSAQVEGFEMNIKDRAQVYETVKKIVDKYGKITHLANNAGGQFLCPAEDLTQKGFESVVSLNLFGTWIVTRAVFDLSMKKNGGSIVNILIAMQNGYPFLDYFGAKPSRFPMMAHSGAARAGVENMTKTLAIEWGKYGIRLNAISPGTIVGSGILEYPAPVLKQALKEIPRKTVLNRLGTEAEIASAVVFLFSEGASYITGDTLKIDGGITLSAYPATPVNDKATSAYVGYATAEETLGPKSPAILKQLLDSYRQKSNL